MFGILRPGTEVTISAAFVFGVALALLGRLKLSLCEEENVETRGRRTSWWVFNAALIPIVLAVGPVLDTFGAIPVLIFGSAATAVGISALSLGPAPVQGLALTLVGATGAAMLGITSIVLMPDAIYPGEPAASINLGLVFVTAGALVTPALADVLRHALGVRRALEVLALACLVPGVLAAVAGADLQPGAALEMPEMTRVLSGNWLWLACAVVALYVPVEASVSFWAVPYLTDRGVDARRPGSVLWGFWSASLVSRVLTAALMHGGYVRPSWDGWVLVVSSFFAVVLLGNMAGAVGTAGAERGLVLLGFCVGPVLPTLIGMVFERIDGADLHAHGTALGMLFASGSLGSLVLAPVIASTGRKQTARSALRVPIFGGLLLTGMALVFGLAA